jgi:exodeoxyribonuclease VII large subunit
VALAGRLDALSPLRVLERGYAIAFGPDGRALRHAQQVRVGDAIRARLHEGELVARVESVVGAPNGSMHGSADERENEGTS